MGDNDAEKFLKLVQDILLNQVIREPTRGDNILHTILTNRVDTVYVGLHTTTSTLRV